MPIVHAHFYDFVADEARAKRIIEGMTQVCIDVGASRESVQVLVHGTPMTHWGKGGQPASEQSPKLSKDDK